MTTDTIITIEKDGELYTAYAKIYWSLKKCNTLYEPIEFPEIDDIDIRRIKDENDNDVKETRELEEMITDKIMEMY